jgi:hypothetical protein
MTIMISKERLLFVSAPKVACSSIKTAFFEIENGFPFQPFYANGVYRHIHDVAVYPAVSFDRVKSWTHDGFFRLTMVRDPVSRFLSAYSNRVLYYKELSAERIGDRLAESGLPPDPSLSVFVDFFDEYRLASNSIRIHTDPMVFYIGADPSFYDHIFNIRQIKQFDQVVSEYIGRKYETPHIQAGGPKLERSTLSDSQTEKIMMFYASDYKFYKEWFETN